MSQTKSSKIPTRKTLPPLFMSRQALEMEKVIENTLILYASRAVQFHPMGVNSISSCSAHVRSMGVHRTCGELDGIKKNTHPRNITALMRD